MKQNCEVCGSTLTDENRSKSYRNRCKRCVAQAVSFKRSQIKHQTNAQERTVKIVRSIEARKVIEDDIVRFIRHEAMRVGVMEDEVKECIKKFVNLPSVDAYQRLVPKFEKGDEVVSATGVCLRIDAVPCHLQKVKMV